MNFLWHVTQRWFFNWANNETQLTEWLLPKPEDQRQTLITLIEHGFNCKGKTKIKKKRLKLLLVKQQLSKFRRKIWKNYSNTSNPVCTGIQTLNRMIRPITTKPGLPPIKVLGTFKVVILLSFKQSLQSRGSLVIWDLKSALVMTSVTTCWCFVEPVPTFQHLLSCPHSAFTRLDSISVTRLGDLLDFGQVFKAFGNNYFAQISHTLRQFL